MTKPFTLTLGMVPDLALGGNSRLHWAKRHQIFQAEKREWFYEIKAAHSGRLPKYKHLKLSVELVFKVKRTRDQDGLMIAMKALFDTLVDLGIITDDDVEHLTTTLTVIMDPKRAPRTILSCEEANP